MKLIKNGLAAAITALALSSGAQAQVYSFGCITGNNAGDCAIGEAQLSVTLADLGAGGVSFTFNNAGPLDSSIADIYFGSDLDLSGAFSISDSGAGVSFSAGASPGALPGGGPNYTWGFTADSDAPAAPNGVNSGEFVTFTFSDASYADVFAAFSSTGAGSYIGVHVQAFESGGSEGFVTAPPIPEPSTYALMLAGLGVVGWMARRRRPV